jgi:hypothetical protein
MFECFADFKDFVSILQGIATILAIVFGGLWFWQRRQKLPRAKATHKIQSWQLPDKRWLLRVTTYIENNGEVLLEFHHGFIRVQQMMPWPDEITPPPMDTKDGQTEVEWKQLAQMNIDFKTGQREIEPHETDEIHAEFILPSEVEMVVVYSYLHNVKKPYEDPFFPRDNNQKDIGWSATTIHKLTASE